MNGAHPFTIVVGIDFSPLSDRALDHALETASLHDGAEVHVLYVEPDLWVGATFASALEQPSPDEHLKKVQERARERVDAIPRELDRRRIRRVVAHFRRGAPAENVAQLAADLDADLVVVGSHGHRGLERIFLGSVAERVSRLARCPVWIVRPKDHRAAGHVPEIEPPCPECLRARQASDGKEMWCAHHAEHRYLRPHVYSYTSDGLYAEESRPYRATPEK